MRILAAILKVLKFPLKLLASLIGNKKKIPQRTELEQNQLKHIQNFDPTRLKNKSWQKNIGKDKKKRSKKNKKFIKSLNK